MSPGDIESKARLVRHEVSDSPWPLVAASLEIQLPARKVKNWGILRSSNPMPPPVPGRETVAANLAPAMETVRLVPFGAAKLRITYFPVARPDAPSTPSP